MPKKPRRKKNRSAKAASRVIEVTDDGVIDVECEHSRDCECVACVGPHPMDCSCGVCQRKDGSLPPARVQLEKVLDEIKARALRAAGQRKLVRLGVTILIEGARAVLEERR